MLQASFLTMWLIKLVHWHGSYLTFDSLVSLLLDMQNVLSHLGLFCLHREISMKNGIRFKTTPDAPNNDSGLT